MSVSPDSEMFAGDAPQFDEVAAVTEIKSELEAAEVDLPTIEDVIRTLSVDQDGVYTGQTDKVRFTVLRGLNGRYLLKTRPLSEEEKE